MKRISLFFFFNYAFFVNAQHPIVSTPLGPVKGSVRKSFQGRSFSAFEGIPYAKPPVGDRRFELPESIEPWNGTWEALLPTTCAQTSTFSENETYGDEDCLHINVYVPRENPNPDEGLNVVVHIHGGAYMYCSGHFYGHPEVLMDRELVFVTFNYRLGILGFLSTEDDVVPGNNGLKDQVVALQWVQNNIASFGGNPKSVTLHGMSAGAGSVHFHYFSEMSKGLFHRGYSQSGVAINTFSIQEGALEKAKVLAEAVGCPSSNTQTLVKCLKQRPVKQLLGQMRLFFAYSTLPISPFAPVVEKGTKPFLIEHPYELLMKGQVYDIPWIASNTADEGHLLEIFLPKGSFNFEITKWQTFAPIFLEFNYTIDSSLWTNTSERIKEFYFGSNDVNEENFDILCRMYGDRTFSVDEQNAVRMQAKVTNSPVYYYLFSYAGEGRKYVPHSADTKYIFGPSIMDPQPLNKNELQLRNVLLDLLVSYAKTGTPTTYGIEWKPTKNEKLTYLDITGYTKEEINLKEVDELAPAKFWQFLEELEHKNRVSYKEDL